MNKWGLVAVIILLQTSALGVMVGMKQYTRLYGTPIVLEVIQVDPRSLFRGDYVNLTFNISNLNPSEIEGDLDYQRYNPVWVVVREAEPHWVAVSFHRERPEVAAGQVVLQGQVLSIRTWGKQEKHFISVKYGIENYFVPEGEGRELEQPQGEERISVRVAVDDYGNSAIQALLLNGQERYRETLF